MDLGGGFGLFKGQVGVKIGPAEVKRLADTSLLSLDIVQHYYCMQAEEARKRAKKTRDEGEKITFTKRANDMQEKRDEVFNTLLELNKKLSEFSLKPSDSEKITSDLVDSFREHKKEVFEYGEGISDKNVTTALKELHLAYDEASPFLIKMEITDPPDGEKVGMTYIVKGEVSDPTYQVYVLVHPLMTDTWWVQTIPEVSPDGTWRTRCYFGTETAGIGEPFEIIALAATEKNLLHSGQTIPVGRLPETAIKSRIIQVERTQ